MFKILKLFALIMLASAISLPAWAEDDTPPSLPTFVYGNYYLDGERVLSARVRVFVDGAYLKDVTFVETGEYMVRVPVLCDLLSFSAAGVVIPQTQACLPGEIFRLDLYGTSWGLSPDTLSNFIFLPMIVNEKPRSTGD